MADDFYPDRLDREFVAEPQEIEPTAPLSQFIESPIYVKTPIYTKVTAVLSIIGALKKTRIATGYILGKWENRQIDLSQVRGGAELKEFFNKDKVTIKDIDGLFVMVFENTYKAARNNILDTIAFGVAAAIRIKGCSE